MQLSKVVFGLNLPSSIIPGEAVTAEICMEAFLTLLWTFAEEWVDVRTASCTQVSPAKLA